MLKGIPTIISPELMKIMMLMGHVDELLRADANFPSYSHAKRIIMADGHNIPKLLDAILKFFPLDKYVKNPVILMNVVHGDVVKPEIWETYKEIIKKYGESATNFGYMERFDFYERAKNAFSIVATSEKILYANIILKKGII